MSDQMETSSSLAPRQFGIAGMMSLIVACAAYFGVLKNASEFVVVHPPWNEQLRFIASAFIGWGVLWFVYRYWNLRPAMTVHYTGPIIFVPLSLLLVCSGAPTVIEILLGVSYGFFASVLFGFPVVAIMLFARVMRRSL